MQLRVAVVGESLVAQRLEPLEADLPAGVRLAYLASPGEVACGSPAPTCRRSAAVRDRAARRCWARPSAGRATTTLARQRAAAPLVARGPTVAVAESLDRWAGRCRRSSTCPGRPQALVGGVVAYATDRKAALLGVPADLLARVGAVHPDVGRGDGRRGTDSGRRRLGAWRPRAWPGPTRRPASEPGTACVAVAGPGGTGAHACALRGRPGGRPARWPRCTPSTCSAGGLLGLPHEPWNSPGDYTVACAVRVMWPAASGCRVRRRGVRW